MVEPNDLQPQDRDESVHANDPTQKQIDEYDKLKAANDKVAAELARGEELRAKVLSGGQTTQQPQEEKKEETDKEYSERIDKEIRDGTLNEK